MKAGKRMLCMGMAGFLAAQMIIPSLAASPEFSRSAEEWARLRDDQIEYDELADLIHEYNATVQKNRIDLNEFRKDYGESNAEWADRYRELADDLEDELDYPDMEDSGYASIMTKIVSSEQQIKNWRETADDALEDYQVYYYDYSLAEALLVSNAQATMIQYYAAQIQQQVNQKSLELAQETLRDSEAQKNLGIGTEIEYLSARESMRTCEKSTQDDATTIDQNRRKLLVLLGWKQDDTPVVGMIPEVDEKRIAQMNPEEDKAAAVENSYSMKSTRRKLENAKSTDIIDTLKEDLKEGEENIGAALNRSYQSVLSNQSAYQLAVAQAALEQNRFASAERNYLLGTESRLQYLTQKNKAETAVLSIQTARLNLFQAVQAYDWVINGLADTATS